MKLNVLALGLACGILWGICLAICTLLGVWFDYGKGVLDLVASVYPGYQITYLGSLLGLVYGFVDGLIGGVIFAWLYNLLVRPKTS